MPSITRPRDGAAGRRGVEALSDFPWKAQIAGVTLAVAPRQVDADGIAPDMIERLPDRDVAPAEPERDHQFHLELEIRGERRIWHMGAIANHSVPRLLEEERWIALVGFLHLANMIDIVAADGINAAHRKPTAADDRQFGLGDAGQHAFCRDVHAFDPGCSAICPLYQSRICLPFQCTTPSNLLASSYIASRY